MSSPSIHGPRSRDFRDHLRKTKVAIAGTAAVVLVSLLLLYQGTPARFVAPARQTGISYPISQLRGKSGDSSSENSADSNDGGVSDAVTELPATSEEPASIAGEEMKTKVRPGDSQPAVPNSTGNPEEELTTPQDEQPVMASSFAAVVGITKKPTARPRAVTVAPKAPIVPSQAGILTMDPDVGERLLVYMQGEPKSGTTWLELIVNDMMDLYVRENLCKACSIKGNVGDSWRTIVNAQVVVNGMTFRNLVFERKHKHALALDPTQNPPTIRSMNARARQAKDYYAGWVMLKGPLPSQIIEGAYEQCVKFHLAHSWDAHTPCPSLRPPPPVANRRFLVILRDPRALIVSGFHYFKKKGANTMGDYLQQHAVGVIQRVAMRYYWFAKVVDQRTVLLLHYHEMKEDPLYNFLEISHFLGMDLTTEHIRGVIANTSVNAMHKLEEHHDLPHTNRAGQDTAKVRSGTVDEWREEIVGENLKFVNQVMIDNMPADLCKEFFNADDIIARQSEATTPGAGR